MNWVVYLLRCGDESLYTGITNDVDARLEKHNAGKGAKYTRGRAPLSLVYQESHDSKESALRREIEIKSWSRGRKMMLVDGWAGRGDPSLRSR